VTSRAGRLAVALVTAVAITSGCNNDQDGTAGAPVVTRGQESAVPHSPQPSTPSGNLEGATESAVRTDGPAAVVAPPPAAAVVVPTPAEAIERTFELPPVKPPESVGSEATVSVPSDCSIPGSECDAYPGDDAGSGDSEDNPPQGGDVNPGGSEDMSRRQSGDDPAGSESSTPTESGSATRESQE
jgi:hypothetical protein